MPGFLDGLLNFASAATPAAAGFAQGRQIKQERERQAEIDEQEREAEKRRKALENAILALDVQERVFPTPEAPEIPKPPTFDVNDEGDVSARGFRDPADVESFRERFPVTPDVEPSLEDRAEEARVIAEAHASGTRAGAPPTPRAQARPTEVQNRFRIVLPRAETSLGTIESLLGEFQGRVPESTLLGRLPFGGQHATPEDEQTYNQAAEALATAILRAESGAAITEAEIDSYRRQFIPVPGDKPDVIRSKLEAIRETLRAMREVAGGDSVSAGDATNPTPSTAGGKLPWQRRADQLRAAGLTPDQITVRLRAEGLIR